ncbi:MAG: hypothetical protein ABL962_05660 [Fimbriimonadaceae bacterium]
MHAQQYADGHTEELKTHLNITADLFYDAELEAFMGEVLEVAMKQIEEVFSDMFGVALFRESYIYAFNSFVLPGSGARLGNYPALATRVAYMRRFATELKLDLKKQPELPPEQSSKRKGVRAIADIIVDQAVPAVIKSAKSLVAELSFHDGDSAADIRTNFRNKVPALQPRSPVEVLNATWEVYLDWLEHAATNKERHEKFRVMNNLCLKSLETYEISRKSPFR